MNTFLYHSVCGIKKRFLLIFLSNFQKQMSHYRINAILYPFNKFWDYKASF